MRSFIWLSTIVVAFVSAFFVSIPFTLWIILPIVKRVPGLRWLVREPKHKDLFTPEQHAKIAACSNELDSIEKTIDTRVAMLKGH